MDRLAVGMAEACWPDDGANAIASGAVASTGTRRS
jgi:hypothetical protein